MFVTPRMLATAGGAILVSGLAFWYSDLYLGTYLMNVLHHHAATFVFIIVAAVAALALFAIDRAVAAVSLLVVAFIGMIGFMAYGSYLGDKAYASELTRQKEVLPAFGERTAWEVASNRVDSDKGDLKGTTLRPRYRPQEETFGTLVEAPGFTAGYAGVVEQNISPTGATKATFCKFGEGKGKNGYRLGGNFDGNLQREISHKDRGLLVKAEDAYGYCDDGKAVAVVPLQKYKGFYPVTRVPAGVAVYKDGKVTVERNVKPGSLPGAVYPISLAGIQRASLSAVDATFYTWIRNRAGFTEATTKGDPNGENPTEFLLSNASGKDTLYVTPMTDNPKQKQAKISAYVLVEARGVTAGQREPMELFQVPLDERREANGVVVDNIKSFYSDADYGWAQGLKVFEMVPAAKGEWIASLGYEKSVKFRVRLAADGSSCLEDTQGNELRCVDASGQVIKQDEPVGTDTPTAPGGTTAVTGLTTEQLAALQKAITDELVKRASAGE